jgi:Copper type II ascorbate-dependent monooxygenase, C-terminal domain
MTKFLLVPTLALVACSSSSGPATDGGFQHDLVLTMELTVPAHQELHTCQLARIPSTTDVDAVAFSHEYSPGSHHFLVVQTDLDSIPPDLSGQYDCTFGNEPIMQHARGVVYGAQTPTGNFPLPTGVGYHFKAGQIVILQAHYLNRTNQAIDAVLHFGIDEGRAADIKQQAGYLFFYDPFIYVPAGATAASGISCAVPSDINLISASTHYHQRGTGMRVWLDESAGTPTDEPFYQTHDWQHSANFRGPFDVPAGSRLRFRCDYDNADATDVFEGPNAATSEMCVFGGLYYPKLNDSFDNCESLSVVGTGSASCSDLVTCETDCAELNADSDTCREKCFVSGCPSAADQFFALRACAERECQEECAAGQCRPCALAKCATEAAKCLSQTCTP